MIKNPDIEHWRELAGRGHKLTGDAINALCDQALIPEALQQPMQEVLDLFATNGHHAPLDTEVDRINTGLERMFRAFINVDLAAEVAQDRCIVAVKTMEEILSVLQLARISGRVVSDVQFMLMHKRDLKVKPLSTEELLQLAKGPVEIASDKTAGHAAAAAIAYALDRNTEEGLAFLSNWQEGDFEDIRREWPNAPASVFVGAEPDYDEAFERWFKNAYPMFERQNRDAGTKMKMRDAWRAARSGG